MLHNLVNRLDMPLSGPLNRAAGDPRADADHGMLDALVEGQIVPAHPSALPDEDAAALRRRVEELETAVAALRAAQAGQETAREARDADADLSPAQLDALVSRVFAAMRDDIEKSAAKAAAAMLREEIARMFSGQDG
jgi:hypothetical protein